MLCRAGSRGRVESERPNGSAHSTSLLSTPSLFTGWQSVPFQQTELQDALPHTHPKRRALFIRQIFLSISVSPLKVSRENCQEKRSKQVEPRIKADNRTAGRQQENLPSQLGNLKSFLPHGNTAVILDASPPGARDLLLHT